MVSGLNNAIRVQPRALRTAFAAVALAAGVVVGAPSAQADAGIPAGFAPAVAETAAATLSADANLSTAAAMQRLGTQTDRAQVGRDLADRLGADAAGFWLDQAAGTVVVNVTSTAAADAVRAAGATPKSVERSMATLEAIHGQLTAAQPADTAIGIDVPGNQVVVQLGAAAAQDPKFTTLTAAVDQLGPAVRVEKIEGSFSPYIDGGYPIVSSSGGRCSLGFHTTGNAAVTAGHCTQAIPQWWEGCCGSGYFGPSTHYSFPGNDFGQIRNDGGLPHNNGMVYLYNGTSQDITDATDPAPNMSVCKSGSTTGLTCGGVYNVNVTICYQEGCVGGLAQSDAYAAAGDSGGSWFSGGWALGLTSGGGGGWTYFQPVVEALQTYGVWVF
jgi:streptogrisin D